MGGRGRPLLLLPRLLSLVLRPLEAVRVHGDQLAHFQALLEPAMPDKNSVTISEELRHPDPFQGVHRRIVLSAADDVRHAQLRTPSHNERGLIRGDRRAAVGANSLVQEFEHSRLPSRSAVSDQKERAPREELSCSCAHFSASLSGTEHSALRLTPSVPLLNWAAVRA